MANPTQVYDPEDQDKDLDSLSPDELGDLRQKYSTKGDEKEDRDIEKGADPADQPRGGMGRKLRQHGEANDTEDADADARNQALNDYWNSAKGEDDEAGQNFYKNYEGKQTGIRGLVTRRRAIGLGIGGTLFAIIFGLSGFLGVFKMDHVMSNIDAKAFARMNGSLDARNTSYIRTYMELRLADICPGASDASCVSVKDTDNLLFRTDKVKRGNPIFNWYRTLRSSSFEKDVFNKNGVFFTSASYRDGNTIKFRTVKVTIGGQDVVGTGIAMPGDLQQALKDAYTSGNWKEINSQFADEFGNFVSDLDKYNNVEFFTSNSDRRTAIKKYVNDNTSFFNVFERRQLRKDISNKTGVQSWRFFDDTRAKIDAKKLKIRNTLIDAVTPDSTKTGKFLNCLFGISSCSFSSDTSAPVNNTSASPPENTKQELSDPAPTEDCQKDIAKCTIPNDVVDVDYGAAADAIKAGFSGILSAIDAGNWASILNSFATVDKNITDGSLAAQVAIARGTQAMAVYQTFETVRDQMKTGQANPTEVNQFMEGTRNITSSEAWVKTVDGKGDPTKLTDTAASQKYCADNNTPTEKDYAYLCDSTVVGSSATGAASLQNWYSNGVGRILHPILKTWDGTFGWFGDAFNWVFQKIAGPIIDLSLKAMHDLVPSLGNDLKKGVAYAGSQLANKLGSVLQMNQQTTSGQIGNMLVQGGAFSGESANRNTGAAFTTTASKSVAQKNLLGYEQAQTSQQSLATRYLLPSNPTSPVANSLFAISQLKLSSVASLFNPISNYKLLGSILSWPFTNHASAASADDGYVAAEVAQIQTYDFPSQCYNTDPLDMTPQNGTNIQSVLGKDVVSDDAMANLSWDTVTNSQKWYAFIYSFSKSNDHINPKDLTSPTYAQQIFNCNLLDNSVRGGLGFLYGYTADNGYTQ